MKRSVVGSVWSIYSFLWQRKGGIAHSLSCRCWASSKQNTGSRVQFVCNFTNDRLSSSCLRSSSLPLRINHHLDTRTEFPQSDLVVLYLHFILNLGYVFDSILHCTNRCSWPGTPDFSLALNPNLHSVTMVWCFLLISTIASTFVAPFSKLKSPGMAQRKYTG